MVRKTTKRPVKKRIFETYEIGRTPEPAVAAFLKPEPIFTRSATATLDECRSMYEQRNTEYADNMADENLITTFTVATLKAIAIHGPQGVRTALTQAELRLIQLAALIDVKDGRLLGPYKKDTVVDGINYRAVWAHLMDQYVSS